MLILHPKCDQNVLSKNSLSTVNRSSQCSQDVITGFRVPLPPVPSLRAVNTSAAEVGNSGAAKIRKSVSYMTQRNAIQYTNVYMDVVNRCKYLSMKQKGLF